MPALQQQ